MDDQAISRQLRGARYLPISLFGVGLLFSVLLWIALYGSEQRRRELALDTETGALERTLRGALDERGRALVRTAQRWQLAGGRTREEFELEAEVNRQSYPSFRSLGWVGPDMVVRWVYPERGNEKAIGLDNGRDPIRSRALKLAMRTGGSALTGPLNLVQGGRGLILFQPIKPVNGRAQGFIYAAIAPATLLSRELGNSVPSYALRVSVASEPVFVRSSRNGLRPLGSPSRTRHLNFGGTAWTLEAWAPSQSLLRLSTIAPLLSLLLFTALATAARWSLRAQGRAWAAERELVLREARFQSELEQAELKSARESEGRIRRVLDQLFAFVGITELDGTLIEANRAPLEAAGLTAGEVLHRPVWDAYWFSHEPTAQAQLKNAVARAASGEVVRYDVPVRLANDAIATIDFQISPLRDGDGAITHLVPSAVVVEERVRAQAELRQRVAQLRSVYNGVPVGLAFHDRELRFLEVNDYLAAINGRPVTEHLGRTVSEVLPDFAQFLEPIMRRVIDTGEAVVGVETRIATAGTDQERDFLLSYTPARDRGGDVIGLTVAVVDITDQKTAEAAIRSSEARFRRLADAMPALVYTARDRQNTYVNARYVEYAGLSADDLMGDGWLRVLHPDDAKLLSNPASLTRAGMLEAELRLRRADGQWRWHLVRGMAYPDDPTLWIGAMLDVHDRREAEARLAESEIRYGTLIRSIDAGFSLLEIIFDGDEARDYRFLEVNPAFERQTGLVDAVGRTVSHLVPDLEDHWVRIYGRVAATGEPARFENEASALNRWFDVYAVPVGERAPYHVGVLFNDISARRLAEEEVRQLNRDLETRVEARTRELASANEELNAFAYTVSHDLRAPLRAMEGFARILLEDYADSFDEAGRRYAQRIVVAATRMESLIHDLLEYSRLARAELRLRPVDLGPPARRCIEDLRATNPEATFEIDGKLPVVLGDPAILSQILCNLIGNAAKFTKPGVPARVRLRGEDLGPSARLWIEDEGIGIAPEHQDRIWLVFERLHGQDSYSGTGVGLGIVHKGVERLGGTCGIVSEPGQGSRFWIELAKVETAHV